MSGLKVRPYYSLKLKLEIIDEVVSGRISKQMANRVYGIRGHSTISKWIDKFGLKMTSMEDCGSKDYKKRIVELEQLLEHERLKRVAAEELIKVAEKELKISIRKKSDTKQLKK